MVWAGRKGGRKEGEIVELVAGIVGVSFQLGADDGHLALELGGIERRVLHPVGFDADRKLKTVRGDQLVVLRAVHARIRIDLTAIGAEQLIDGPGRKVFRAFEHHMFKDVRQSGLSIQLITGADLVPDAEIHDRRRVYFLAEDREAVSEMRLGDHLGSVVLLGHDLAVIRGGMSSARNGEGQK